MSYTKEKRLELAYNKAHKNYEKLKKAGFNFTKTFEKAMEYDTYLNKQMKVTTRDINYYKKVAKKTELYKRAKSYTDIDTNKTITVKQGKINQMRKRKAEKMQKEQVVNLFASLEDAIKEIPDEVFTRDAGNVDISPEKNELLNIAMEFSEKGIQPSTELIGEVKEVVHDLMYPSSSPRLYSMLDRIKTILGAALGEKVYASDSGMEMIGTPFESE